MGAAARVQWEAPHLLLPPLLLLTAPPPPPQAFWKHIWLHNRTDVSYGHDVAQYTKADYCFIPYGDGWGNRITHAMLHACVPVIVQVGGGKWRVRGGGWCVCGGGILSYACMCAPLLVIVQVGGGWRGQSGSLGGEGGGEGIMILFFACMCACH